MLNTLSKKNKILILISIILFLIVVPLTLIQVQKQQQIRQRASENPQISLQLSPAVITKNMGNEFDVNLNFKSNGPKDISGFDVIIKYDPNILELVSFTLSPSFTETRNTSVPGTFKYIATYGSLIPSNQLDLTLGTLKFRGKANGTSNVTFESINITDGITKNYLSVDTPNNVTGTYTISPNVPTSTPIPPTSIPTSTPVPSPTIIQSPTPVTSVTPSITTSPVPPTATLIPTTTITPTVTPATTPAPGDNFVTFDFKFEGIIDPNSASHPQKNITIYLYGAADDPSKDLDGKNAKLKISQILKFNTVKKSYESEKPVNIGKLDAGTKILIKIDKYLRKLVQYTKTPSNGTFAINIPSDTVFASGDIDGNNVIDIRDYEIIRGCIKDKTCVSKDLADLNEDGVIDGIDYNVFLKSLSLTVRHGD